MKLHAGSICLLTCTMQWVKVTTIYWEVVLCAAGRTGTVHIASGTSHDTNTLAKPLPSAVVIYKQSVTSL